MAAGKNRGGAYAIASGIDGGAPAWARFASEWQGGVRAVAPPAKDTPMEGLSADIDKLTESDGVYVGALKDDAPCAKAGLKSKDVILEVDGKTAAHYGKLILPLRRKKPGETALLKVKRGEETV